MQFIAVDDEPLALRDLMEKLQEANPDGRIQGFTSPAQALAYTKANPVDVAFLDIEMAEMNGLELSKALKEQRPALNIVFVTGFSKYAVDAFSLFVSGYLLKPVSKDGIQQALQHLRSPVRRSSGLVPRIQTFGNFEVFVNGMPLHFPRSKSKEILAFLIHKRGTCCTLKELTGVIFEDKEYTYSIQKQMQTYISSMMKVLQDASIAQIVIKKYNSLSIDVTKVDCDYYRFLNWEPDAVNEYTGEYMSNYGWAEFTIGYLDSKLG